MRIVKGIITLVLLFLMTILMIASIGTCFISNTILNKKYMMVALERNDYYTKIETDLKNEFENYQYQSGLPEEVFYNLYTKDMIKKDVDSILDFLYHGSEIQNCSEEVQNRVIANINQYLEENKIILNQTQQENKEKFEDLIVNAYENEVNLSSQLVREREKIKTKVEKTFQYVKIGVMGALVIVLLVLIGMYKSTFSIFMNLLSISFLASGILGKLGLWLLHQNVDIEHIVIITQTFSDFIKYIIYDILSKISIFSNVSIITGLVLIIVSSYFKIRKRKTIL